jgi:DNA topoisomerase-1
MIRAGHPPKQAEAAAERMARQDRIGEIATAFDTIWKRFDKEFRETDHPRDEDGKFAEGAGSSGRASLKETKIEGGKRLQANGAPLPSHIEKLKLPPAWKDVRYSDDPKSGLLAVGKDSKGRVQSVYSEEFSATQAAAKFARIEALRKEFDGIQKQNDTYRKSNNPKVRDSADCLSMIMKMGIRPGSETDTGAKLKAYGATTLEGRHVVKTDEGVSLRFIGKKGVALDLPVTDKGLSDMLLARAEKSGTDGKLFPATTDKALLDYVHTLDGGGFKTKDFRTNVGTSTAYDLVSKMPAPKTEAEYKKAVMAVAKDVSKRLGNTPVIALQSYISPTVFSEWRNSL